MTFVKPKKTKHILPITQISQSYGSFSLHRPSMINVFCDIFGQYKRD